jgi:uncharacterized protein (UPF0305 family)
MKRIIVALIFMNTVFGFSQVKIKGVVTYYFNEYQGNKPDIGATVVAVDSTLIKKFDYELWSNYKYGKSYRYIYSNSKKIYENLEYMYNGTLGKKKRIAENEDYKLRMEEAKKSMEDELKTLEKYNSETDEKFKNIDKTLAPSLFQFLSGKEPFIETTVDGVGNYNISVKPGVYYVYIKSKNRTGLTVTDISGTTYITKVKVTNNDKDVSYNFELN